MSMGARVRVRVRARARRRAGRGMARCVARVLTGSGRRRTAISAGAAAAWGTSREGW